MTANRVLSDAGRARMAEAGRRNIGQLAASRQNRREIRQEAAELRRDLLATLPADANPGQRALALSAATSHAALALLLQQILAARSYRRIELLAGLLQPLQGELRRTLGLLGLTAAAAVDAPRSTDTLESIALEYQQKGDADEAD